MASMQRTPPTASSIANNTPSANKRLRSDWESNVPQADDEDVQSVSLEGIMRTMMKQFAETRQLIDTVRSEINNQIVAVKTELKCDIESLKVECTEKFQQQDAALESLEKRVDNVSQTLGALANRNELIISGIPFQNDERLNTVLEDISKHLDINRSSLLAAARRMAPSSSSDKNSLFVVEFALKSTRDQFYSAYLRKRDLKLKHIGMDSDRRIYINESLTVEARNLKSAALNLKKAGKLTSVYTKHGVVHVKSATGGPFNTVRSEDELDKFS
ncbi:uncharacterized protein LOC134215274 [Armigeres subalbatus]|uniref:uncharacterized protein LOC134215274 n=1 Tax=Armigeres subalbatus TaxID=124917 RepID=UPI002ED62DAD